MAFRALLVSAVVCLGLAVGVAWFTDLSFARAALLTPILVLTLGAAAALVMLWTKVVLESVRSSRRGRTNT